MLWRYVIKQWGWKLTASGHSYSLLGILALCGGAITTHRCLFVHSENRDNGPILCQPRWQVWWEQGRQSHICTWWQIRPGPGKVLWNGAMGSPLLLAGAGRPSPWISWRPDICRGEGEGNLKCCEHVRVHSCPMSLLYIIRVMYCQFTWYNNLEAAVKYTVVAACCNINFNIGHIYS